MKFYKLIKEYPGSPRLGYFSEYYGEPFKYFQFDPGLFKEFWEEVIEKEYEILSFINNYNGFIFIKKDNEKFNGKFNRLLSLDTLLHSSSKIYSVKRLSS